jgi:hypothetical protein
LGAPDDWAGADCPNTRTATVLIVPDMPEIAASTVTRDPERRLDPGGLERWERCVPGPTGRAPYRPSLPATWPSDYASR